MEPHAPRAGMGQPIAGREAGSCYSSLADEQLSSLSKIPRIRPPVLLPDSSLKLALVCSTVFIEVEGPPVCSLIKWNMHPFKAQGFSQVHLGLLLCEGGKATTGLSPVHTL